MPTQLRKTILLATDRQNSVLNTLDANNNNATAYTPHGDSLPGDELRSQLRFNGKLKELITDCYSLGNGYRTYNPKLMRFISPDRSSPFGKGGLNAYAYCGGDPVNRTDPSGQSFLGPMVKYMNDRVIKFGGRSGLSPLTIKSLKKTKNNLGGKKLIKHNAAIMSISPEEYLVRQMPEMQPHYISPHPPPSELLSLTPKKQNKLIASTKKTLSKLENKKTVQQDLVNGLAPHIGIDALALLDDSISAISHESELLTILTPSPPPPYDPPPPFDEGMRIRNTNE